ncbi:hypothetical protein LTR78_006623 [Recurvomyces mirabilis]|uniref:NAD(P)-binding domain-containing protein n=2 Tax=Recurvomyces mirabilis TaxID=574656 RepID=A0AAE0WKJ0_9PEZI|nr:hypothetical protein LTR78_006623 [Recurvomyces mirabilis]
MARDRRPILADHRSRQASGFAEHDMSGSMMRIAVAGTGGLARFIAHFVQQDTAHHVVLLSREEKPELSRDHQVIVVDYANIQTLQFALRGIDTVISTVTGQNQIELIRAAISVRVRRFAPAEFEGPPSLRPETSPLDRGRTAAGRWMAYYGQHIETTVFVCGILYERFQPNGLRQTRMGLGSGLSNEGDYIMNCRTMSAQAPAFDANNLPNVTICMTSAQDVAKFVTKALDMPRWPSELRMCGERITVKDLIATVQQMKGQPFNPISWHNPATLRAALEVATARRDPALQIRLHALIATTEGQYDFPEPANMNEAFPDVRPVSFQTWFAAKWNLQRR